MCVCFFKLNIMVSYVKRFLLGATSVYLKSFHRAEVPLQSTWVSGNMLKARLQCTTVKYLTMPSLKSLTNTDIVKNPYVASTYKLFIELIHK